MSTETLVQFGPGNQLVGILSAGPSSSPVLVLPNSGMVPRSGVFRLHVDIARMLETLGVPTFRYDLPGVGESPRIAGCDHLQATMAALEQLHAHYGYDRFVIGGICSAADLGWRLAVNDTRIVGLLMLDGVTFDGPWFRFGKIARLLKRPPMQWPGVVLRFLRRYRPTQPTFVASDYRDWPSREQARLELAGLVARKVQSLWIYTGGASDRFLHPREFYWAFGQAAHSDMNTLKHWPDCDHTFYARAHRDRLLDTLSGWVRSSFSVADSSQ